MKRLRFVSRWSATITTTGDSVAPAAAYRVCAGQTIMSSARFKQRLSKAV